MNCPNTYNASVCLVRPMLSPYEASGHPVELLVLGAALKQHGYNVTIKDYEFLKESDPSWKSGDYFSKRAAKEIVNENYAYVGITAYCSNYVLAIDLARQIKILKQNIHITLGGPQATMCSRETLEMYPHINSIVVGEGEETYPELLGHLEDGKSLESVRGVAYRSTPSEIHVNLQRPLLKNLDDSPIPEYELVNFAEYLKRKSVVSIYVGSGCPFACNFCTTSLMWKRKYRVKSVERIIKEIKQLHEIYGVTQFDFIHDNLTVNKKYLNDLAVPIKNINFPITFELSSRVDTLDKGTAKNIAEAGCTKIFFGIESASENTQREIGKNLKISSMSCPSESDRLMPK